MERRKKMKRSKSSAAETRARGGNVGYRRGAGAWRGTLGAANTGARRPTGETELTPCVSASAAGYKGRYIASPARTIARRAARVAVRAHVPAPGGGPRCAMRATRAWAACKIQS